MTLGLLVLVQLVMAAMTTSPWVRWYSLPSSSRTATLAGAASVAVPPSLCMAAPPPLPAGLPAALFSRNLGSSRCHAAFISLSCTRSCGRAGPARLGTMVERSTSTTAV